MGDEDQRKDEDRQADEKRPPTPSPTPPPAAKPASPGEPASDKLGSEEAGLHETAGSGVSMPEWADSLSHATEGPLPPRHSRVNVDLAKRLREEEAARIARKKAEEEARRKAAEEAARKKAEEEARRKAAARQAAQSAAARRKSKKVSRWPSVLAALAVIALGAFVGQRIVGTESAPQGAATSFPLASTEPVASGTPAPASAPDTPAPGDRLDTYTVKPGDTLESIADQFGRTPREISKVNGAYGGLIRIRPGQVINIP